jgi:hypothetical protein
MDRPMVKQHFDTRSIETISFFESGIIAKKVEGGSNVLGRY